MHQLSGALSVLESLLFRFLVEVTMATLGVPNANLNVGRKAPRFAFSRPKKPIPRDMAHLKNEMVMSNLLQEIYNISYHAEVKSMMIRERQVQPGDITGNLSESARVIVDLELHNGEQHCYHWFVKILPKEHKNSELMHKFNSSLYGLPFVYRCVLNAKTFCKKIQNILGKMSIS